MPIFFIMERLRLARGTVSQVIVKEIVEIAIAFSLVT